MVPLLLVLVACEGAGEAGRTVRRPKLIVPTNLRQGMATDGMLEVDCDVCISSEFLMRSGLKFCIVCFRSV